MDASPAHALQPFLPGNFRMPDFPIIDSHVHLCDPQRLSYGWMKDAPSLNRQVLPADFQKASGPVSVERFVFVEVDVDPPHRIHEAEWVENLAGKHERIGAIVASLPMEKGKAIEPDLDKLRRLPHLRGVRRLIQSEPDPDFCLRPDFIEALGLLAAHDLSFDICIYHHQMPSVIKLVRRCPNMRFVLDHIGKPGIKAGLFEPWKRHIRELAAFPNVHCKISGVMTEADHRNWTREQLKPYILHAMDAFGFDRIMFGGDWHVCELAGSFPQWVDIVDWVTEGATADEKRKLFRGNVTRFYKLTP
jgi:L-fuconolactonase